MSVTTKCGVHLRDKHRCIWCEDFIPTREEHSVDHFIPRSAGGKSVATNLLTACIRCNGARRDARDSFAGYLARRGKDLAEALARAMIQLATPIDRAAGRALADAWYPGLYARKAAREKRRQNKVREKRRLSKAAGVLGGSWFDPNVLEAM